MSDSTRASKRIRFTIEDDLLPYLEACRNITPPSGGIRKISVKSYSPLSSPDSDEMTDVPEVAESVETLKMAGFSQEAAEKVFDNFKRVRDDENYDQYGDFGRHAELRELACGYIDGKAAFRDASLPSHDYREAWKHLGMATERYERLMDPEFNTIRLADSASAHFKESVNATAEYVFSMSKNIKALQRLEVSDRQDSSPSPTLRPTPARRGREQERQAKAPPAPIVQTEVEFPHKVDGCTMLYKGASLARLELIFPDPQSSRIMFEELVSSPPTDFHRTNPDIFYATKQLEIAEKYCGWFAARDGEHVKQAILRIALPSELTERIDFRWIHDPDWRRLIWASRGRRERGSGLWRMPSDLAEYGSGFGLAGNICDRGTHGLERLNGDSDVHAMRLSDGSKATQYAFFADAYQLLNEHCEGKIWIDERALTPANKLEKSNGKAVTRAKMS